ncbi:hypothetical protein E2C01_058158 [Portunus trituberculatus]|uniref:CCHC-type domain-containing protein n=1 Tax=Portunus trituberculatus TaxID=210409 RepID=A0A5B7H288_PORTR|nr:hypothetical protein [Portunus trituberculatus]
MRNSCNMVLLTFFGSSLPDCVYIGSINLRVRRFVSRPLQCFSCYGYGHGKSSCKEASRCDNCSALNSHSEEHCNSATYCFHFCDAHQVRSRQCPRYRLEEDILLLANNQFISLGSARGELLYRQKDGTGATFYASLAVAHQPSLQVRRHLLTLTLLWLVVLQFVWVIGLPFCLMTQLSHLKDVTGILRP